MAKEKFCFTWFKKTNLELNREELLTVIEYLYNENKQQNKELAEYSSDIRKHRYFSGKKNMQDIPIKEKKYRYDVIKTSSLNLLKKEINSDMRMNWKPLGPVVIEKRGFIFPEIFYLQTMVRNDNE